MIPAATYNIRVWHASVRGTRSAIAEFGHIDPVTYDVAQPMAAPIDNYELAYSALLWQKEASDKPSKFELFMFS